MIRIPVGQFEKEEYHVFEIEHQSHKQFGEFLDVDLHTREGTESFEVYPEQAKKLIEELSKII